jgi:hypothetical protein
MTQYITGWSKWFGRMSPMHPDYMTEEEWNRRKRAAEDEGRIPVEGSNRGVVYVYREYVGFPDFDVPTDHYIEQRWIMGKAPDRQVWDYGRSELRRVYTAAPAHFKGSGWASKS